jgi:TetR/AcrR family fatty acid metabolism transcriptional regulator
MPKKTETRQSTIRPAIEVFSKNNVSTPMISEIAQNTNVAEGTIHQFFKNKENLFFSILVEKTKEFRKELNLHFKGISGAFNKIKRFMWCHLYFFKMNPEYGRILLLEMRVSKSFTDMSVFRNDAVHLK